MNLRSLALYFASALTVCVGVAASHVSAQEILPDATTIVSARVVAAHVPVVQEGDGFVKKRQEQTITARIEEGKEEGSEVTFTNDYVMLEAGDRFFMKRTASWSNDAVFYSVADPYRLHVLWWLCALFVYVCIGVGRWQGLRGMISLCVSIAALYYLLIPLVLHGYNPVLSSLAVASIIVTLGSYVTHGISRTTSAAVVGMIATIALCGIVAQIAIHYARLTGYAAEEAVYLTLNTDGGLSLVALLLGGILIGLLGVLYDSAIGQAIAVEELYRSGCVQGKPHAKTYVFTRAMRIGREHIGALVNTLAIAYVGASLPLLLLVAQTSQSSLLVTLNSEVFATEIIRIIVGSLGVITAVPITTLLAVAMLQRVVFTTVGGDAGHSGHRH